MSGLWIVCLLTVVRGASVQSGNVQWFDLEDTMTYPEHLYILKAKIGVNFQPYEQAWKEYKILHDKTYENLEEELHRFKIFKENVRKIEEHNKLYHLGKKSYYMGVNQFSDLTHEEFVKYNGVKKISSMRRECSAYLSANNLVAPDSVDWRTKGYVTDVKNQGDCGSCWAFGTTGSLEGQHFRKTGILVSLSEQQLVDCSGSFGNNGCNGGIADRAFKYITSVGGIETEHDYPYKAKQELCSFNDSKIAAKVSGCVDVEKGSESALKMTVAEIGPVSVSIDASHDTFQFYKGGVYDEPLCSSTHLGHAVLCVGYSTDDDGQDYWIVKNSWSEKWGDRGYIKMSRNKNNQCGIATAASYPLV